MPEFISQTSPNMCGPVAIYNMLKFFNMKHGANFLIDAEKIKKNCNVREDGTRTFDLYYAIIVNENLDARLRYPITVFDFIEAFTTKHPTVIILSHWYDKDNPKGHYSLITGIDRDGKYIVMNALGAEKSVIRVDEEKIREWISLKPSPESPSIFLIRMMR